MAKKKYEESNIQAIATTIREKTGTEKTYFTSEMAEGVNEVFESGKKEQYLEWWADYLGYKPTNRLPIPMYMGFAGYRWNDTTFDPPYDIFVSSTSSLFSYSYVEDIRGILSRNNVSIIFDESNSKFNQHYNVFANSKVKYLPYLKLPKYGNCYGWFTFCGNLIEVDGYECLEKHTFETSSGTSKTFQGCTNLEHIIFHGTIANNINMQWCTKLDLESLLSLINCLKNFNGSTEEWTKTITLSTESWDLLKAQGNIYTWAEMECDITYYLSEGIRWNMA